MQTLLIGDTHRNAFSLVAKEAGGFGACRVEAFPGAHSRSDSCASFGRGLGEAGRMCLACEPRGDPFLHPVRRRPSAGPWAFLRSCADCKSAPFRFPVFEPP